MRMSAASRGTLPGLPSETLCGALVSCILRSLSWTSDRLTTLTSRVAVSHPWTTINAVETWKQRQKESSQDFRHSFLSALVSKIGTSECNRNKEELPHRERQAEAGPWETAGRSGLSSKSAHRIFATAL